MLELALWKGDLRAQLADISAAQKISLKYLGRIMASLVAAGLVHSKRGKNGGFGLVKLPSEIRVYDILKAVEGPVELAPCMGSRHGACRKFDHCVTRDVWIKVKDGLISILEGISLEDLMKQHLGKRAFQDGSNYSI